MQSRSEIYAAMKSECVRLVEKLTNPEIVPLPPPMIVPPPDLTPPGFDETGLRAAYFALERAADAVMQRIGGVTAGSAESTFRESVWRSAAFDPKRSPSETAACVSGATVGTEAAYFEAPWRKPTVRQSAARLRSLKPGRGNASVATFGELDAVPEQSAVHAPPSPDAVAASSAAAATVRPPAEVDALRAALAEPGEPCFAKGDLAPVPHGIASNVAKLAALPRGPTPVAPDELKRFVIDSLRESAPVQGYLTHRSMSDDATDCGARSVIDTLCTRELRRAESLAIVATAFGTSEALSNNDDRRCTALVWTLRPGGGTSAFASGTLYQCGQAALQALVDEWKRRSNANPCVDSAHSPELAPPPFERAPNAR